VRHRDVPDAWGGCALGAALVVVVAAALVPFRDQLTRAGPALALVLPVVAAGLVGGRIAALVTAVFAATAFNLAFIPPYWTFEIDVANDILALVVFVLVGLAVGTAVAREADRRRTAEERARELEALQHRNEALSEERERLLTEASRLALLEEVDLQRAALLRSVSHDLRTPLATIQAVTSSLREGTAYDDDTRIELLDLVGEEAERLDRIVANLLSMSRIEAGALTPARDAVALDELIAASIRRLRRLLDLARLDVDIPDDLPLADVDYSQLDQVVTNLLENAVRHTPEGTRIRVTARSKGDMIEVSVADDGPGVLPFESARLFEPFRRGERSESSGVGLAICKAIVEAHGGRITVERSPGGGAVFTDTVPAYRG
jgi:two-component system sensor histidine kinase KdpD